MLPSKRCIVCAITNSAVDIGRRAAGQINTLNCRLLIETTQTWSLPLRYSMFTCDEVLPSKRCIVCAITNSAVDIGRRAAGQINTLNCRLLIQTTQTWSAVAVFDDHRSCRSHDRAAVAYIAAESTLPPVST